ncbi:MAG: ABC transporter substrate-binding protein, partial [Pseudorhodobacter sp.]|nr:ABC transporter substrate-binding protein [Pseudorhodobacter sp.]
LTYNVVSAQGGARLTDVYISPDDPWTVVVKTTDMAIAFLEDMGDKMYLYPPEVIEKYGDAKDWRNAVGTGPFILSDYVPGSSITLTRNPNYWQKNPLGPGKGDQLPYADAIIGLQLADISTQITALRTGKVDWLGGLKGEDAEGLLKTNPKINLVKRIAGSKGFTVRGTGTDPLALPYLKQRVRQAVAMAVDKEAIVRDFYGGRAELFVAFWTPE